MVLLRRNIADGLATLTEAALFRCGIRASSGPMRGFREPPVPANRSVLAK